MSAKSALLNVRIDPEIKEKAAAVLAEYGLTVSDAARIILTRIANEGTVPAFLLTTEEEYDAWFRKKVREAMEDPSPSIPHAQVMAEVRAKIEKRRQERAENSTKEARTVFDDLRDDVREEMKISREGVRKSRERQNTPPQTK